MGNKFTNCDGVGNAQKYKICNNMALGIEMASVCEALYLSSKLGLDPKKMASIMINATSKCWSVDTCTPVKGVASTPVPADRNYEFGFTSDLMVKDLGIAIRAANLVGADVTLAKECVKLYQ